jgi:excisionase family DNA binding protein
MIVFPRLLTIREVAQALRQTERTVRDKIASGELTAIRIGSGPRAPIRVDADELERWLLTSRSRAGEAADGPSPRHGLGEGR